MDARAAGAASCVDVPEGQLRDRRRQVLEETFALGLLARQLAGTADGLGLFARFLLGRFLEMLPELHFTEHAFALQLLLQGAERLIDIVVANTDLHVVVTTFLSKLHIVAGMCVLATLFYLV